MSATIWFTPDGVFWQTASEHEPNRWTARVEDFLTVLVQSEDDSIADARLLVVPMAPWEDVPTCHHCGDPCRRLSMSTHFVATCDCHLDDAERALGVE